MKSSLLLIGINTADVLFCYYDNAAQYRSDIARFMPEDIDANLCTHLVFNSARLRQGRINKYSSTRF